MQMPSLFKYFAFVGAALLALISLANFLLEPSTGATVVGQSQPAKATATVQHDPRASKIERWRNEQAALKSTITEPAPATTAATKATWQAEPVAALAEPAKPAAQAAPQAPAAPEPALQTTDASASVADEAARAEQAKAEKIKAAKARKARLARERARAEQQAGANGGGQFYGGYNGGQFYGAPQQRNASNQQDQYYYGQRVPQQRQSYNAYAPRQSYGPFGW
jgi:hypothetical protein